MKSSRSLRPARGPAATRAWCVLGLAITVGACDEPTVPSLAPSAQLTDPMALNVPIGELPEIGPASISAGIEYTWTDGQPPTYMGQNYPVVIGPPTGRRSKRVCYLTGVKGKFPNWSAELTVVLKGTSWYLQGVSQNMGVEGRARCAIVADYSEEYYWDQSLPETPIFHSIYSWACFLTGIGGDFTSSSTMVGVGHRKDTGGWRWRLGGFPGDNPPPPTQVWARCLKPLDGDFLNVSSAEWYRGDLPVPMASTSGNICVLYGLAGYFNHPSKYVIISKTASYWQLFGGGSSTSGGQLWAGSDCYS